MNLSSLPQSVRDKNPHLFADKPSGNKNEKKLKLTPMPAGLLFIVNALLYKNIPFVREYQFAKPRRFRFDIAIYEKKVAIEYEGMRYDRQGGHQSPKGYTSNTVKYNLAAQMGWTIYRYTHLNYKDFSQDLKKIME